MKKTLVLATLFLLPLVFYIFLSKGIYKYSNLPILSEELIDVQEIDSKKHVTFKEHLTIVCFLGNNVPSAKASLFNLNQTIYKRYYEKPHFQIVAIYPSEATANFDLIREELGRFTDIKNWKFVSASNNNIKTLFNSFQTPFELNENLYSEYAFIVDGELRLRGRKDDEDATDGKLYGYTMKSVATLKNKMKDDIDIIYYQLKKSAEKEARRKRKI